MHAEQQRFWIALLNLQRGWATDEAALAVVPTRSRDFASPPDWPQRKALVYLLNALELVRESHRRLEAGQALDYEALNTVLEGLHLRLHPWTDPAERKRAADARQEHGGRLETLQVTSGRTGSNPGTRYVRATVERCLYYFAQYVDDRLSDPLYPAVSPGRWRVVESEESGGDLVLVEPALQAPGFPVTDARRDDYVSPFSTRYAGEAMRALFSERRRIETWRRLWLWLAEAQRELGLPISEAQVASLRDGIADIDFEKAAVYEQRVRHDVMAHVTAYGDAAPEARGVIHLGATSCYVTDNADSLLVRAALGQTARSLATAIAALAAFAQRHAKTPCLAYTHFQPAQPTTMGNGACLWLQDLIDDLAEVERASTRVPFLGSKGTTGTQASFRTLFGGDAAKVEALDQRVAEKAGFAAPVPVSGQTYSRRADYQVLAVLGGIAISGTRFANDVRLLSGHSEVSEPFEPGQIGSSAMAYKRNPMRSERLTAIARHLLALVGEAGAMAAAQWLERSLDDSASRRIVLPEGFLATDSILRLLTNVGSGLVVNEAVCRARLAKDLPFMATEELLMRAAAAGADRQVAHERIRVHSLAARDRLLGGAEHNDLFARLEADPVFAKVKGVLADLTDPLFFTGLAERQTVRFLAEHVEPALSPYRSSLGAAVELKV